MILKSYFIVRYTYDYDYQQSFKFNWNKLNACYNQILLKYAVQDPRSNYGKTFHVYL